MRRSYYRTRTCCSLIPESIQPPLNILCFPTSGCFWLGENQNGVYVCCILLYTCTNFDCSFDILCNISRKIFFTSHLNYSYRIHRKCGFRISSSQSTTPIFSYRILYVVKITQGAKFNGKCYICFHKETFLSDNFIILLFY